MDTPQIQAKISTLELQLVDMKHDAEKQLMFISGQIAALKEILADTDQGWAKTEDTPDTHDTPDSAPMLPEDKE